MLVILGLRGDGGATSHDSSFIAKLKSLESLPNVSYPTPHI